MNQPQHIVILGNGIAGITAARHIRKHSEHRITVISGETEHFFSRTALMYIFMGHMRFEHTKPYEDWFWEKNRISLKKAWVNAVDFSEQNLTTDTGEVIQWDRLIIATGSKSNYFGWPGQDLKGVQALYSYQDLALMEENTQAVKQAVIVGGGLIGVEMAEMLRSRGIAVTYLVRESHFWGNVLPREEGELIRRHLEEHHVRLQTSTELKEILGENGKVKAVQTTNGETIPCQFVGIAVGVSPNVDLFRNTALQLDRGILVDEKLQTNLPNVYAIGDCAQLRQPPAHRRAIEPVWYVGRMMGETVANTICGKPTSYQPGPWFNSAKFFDIEYQTYGSVPAVIPADLHTFYWEAPDGKKCMRLVFEKENLRISGVNLFGLRQRHQVWDGWLRNGATIAEVMSQLESAHFDPELFRRWENTIRQAFQQQFPTIPVSLPTRSFFQKIFQPTS